MAPTPIPDLAERERALDPSRSFIVQAPAGSGKTELLIQRYLTLLATVESPEEIVAITFTKKAAGEMRGRVLAALTAARAGKAPGSAHAARTLSLAQVAVGRDERCGWRIAENPVRLRIQTIDALCNGLTRQMPVLSRFGAAPETVQDASGLYLEAARAAIGRVESDDAVAVDVERLLAHLDNDVARVEGLLAGMLARRDHWVRHLRQFDRTALEAALVHERERLAARAAALYPGAASRDAEAWKALGRELLTKKRTWRIASSEAQALATRPDGEALRAAFAALEDMPPSAYTDSQWEALAAIGSLLTHAIAELKVVFAARGQVDFAEVAEAALFALGGEGEPTDLALALDYRVRHLLVDEFQDTSVTQYRLVAQLTAGWEPGDGRTLFAVGDPMQSIYRFREAEVGEFLRAWKSGRVGGVELERVRLSANFRSQAGIVRWVNAAFAQVMPAGEDVAVGAVPHAVSAPVVDPLPGDAVEIHAFFDGDHDGEAARVVELVGGVRREEPDATVAVLVRNRSHLEYIVPRLRAAGLRFRAVEIESLGNRPVVQDLLALTRALLHPADRLAWLAVLRAPPCGLALADLCALAESDDARTVWELMNDDACTARLSADGSARLVRARDVIADAVADRLRASLRDQVEGAWFALGGPACVEDATALEDAGVYLDALEETAAAGALDDLAQFEERVAKLWALPDVHASETDVQIMTIHKAKGLEFAHVIVPGLGRAPRSDEKRLFLWMERPTGAGEELLVAPIDETGAGDDAIYKRLQMLDAERNGHEAARLLYVAATRARRRLHLLGGTSLDETGAPRAPNAKTLLGKLWRVVAGRFAEAAASAGASPRHAGAGERELPNQDLNQDLVRLPPGWQRPAPPAGPEWDRPAEPPRVFDGLEYSWVGETARHVGTVVHRWLQQLADDALSGWDAARIQRSRVLVRSELAARGVRAANLDGAVERVLAALANSLADPRGRWLLGPHPHAVTEHRVTAVAAGAPEGGAQRGVENLVIDRLFTDAAGERWIVDYKTSTHEGADREGFLDRERERYAPQLERYARALGGVYRLGLYFPLLGGWREI